MRFKTLSLFFLTTFLLISCDEDPIDIPGPNEEPCSEIFVPKEYNRQVIGFYPYYRHTAMPVEDIPWNNLTRVIYAFAFPNNDGTLETNHLSYAETLNALGHKNGVEVFFSIASGGEGQSFIEAISTQAKRDTLINDIVGYMLTFCYEGVDIDYEKFESTEIEENLTMFMYDLQEALAEYGFLISIDVYPSNWNGRHISDEIVSWVDEVNVMAYNFSGPWSEPGPHSSYEQSIGSGDGKYSTGLAYWHNYRGWPKEKLILGVPFYGRDFDNNGGAPITYANILKIDEEAAYASQWNNIYYNGLDVIERKSNYIVENNFPGIMIWEIAQDSANPETNLLTKISTILN